MSRRRKDDSPDASERDVRAALAAMGWVPPASEGDVAATEAQLREEPVELPARLADAAAVLEHPAPGAEATALRLPDAPDIDATLARAAREGGTVTPEIEEIMRRDRAAAEREMDDETRRQ